MTEGEKIRTLMRSGGLEEDAARALLAECGGDLRRAADRLDELENGDIRGDYPPPRQNGHIDPEEIGSVIEKTVKSVIRTVKDELDKGSWKVK